MSVEVKAVRLGDRLMLFINGKKQTVSRKVAPEAFDKAVKLIKEKKHEEIVSMFSDVNKKVGDYAKGIFKIVGNKVFAKGENVPAPKLVARKLFEMMNENINPKPLKVLNKKMHRNGNGVAAGMDIFSKMNSIPMTEYGNLVLKVGFTKEQINHTLETKGVVVGSPLGTNPPIQHDLPVVGYDFKEKDEYVYCLVDPSDIIAFFNGNIRVGRYKILLNYDIEDSSVINVPLEELYDLSFDMWDKQQKSSSFKKGELVNQIQ